MDKIYTECYGEFCAFQRLTAYDRVACRFMTSVLNVNPYDDTTQTASESFVTWDALGDALLYFDFIPPTNGPVDVYVTLLLISGRPVTQVCGVEISSRESRENIQVQYNATCQGTSTHPIASEDDSQEQCTVVRRIMASISSSPVMKQPKGHPTMRTTPHGEDILKMLRKACCTRGGVDGDVILLQGDHRRTVCAQCEKWKWSLAIIMQCEGCPRPTEVESPRRPRPTRKVRNQSLLS